MQILGLLNMFFDAVIVEVANYLLFSEWLWPYCEVVIYWFSYSINRRIFVILFLMSHRTNIELILAERASMAVKVSLFVFRQI